MLFYNRCRLISMNFWNEIDISMLFLSPGIRKHFCACSRSQSSLTFELQMSRCLPVVYLNVEALLAFNRCKLKIYKKIDPI